MPIFFGWGHTTKKIFGPAFKQLCSHCHNEEYWILTRVRVWFTLFFIPLIPYENKYYLTCPICEYGLTLNSEQINSIRPIAEINQLLVDGSISKEEYQNRILSLNGGTGNAQEEVKVHDVEPVQNVETVGTGSKFCSECGKNLIPEAKFCGHCGSHAHK